MTDPQISQIRLPLQCKSGQVALIRKNERQKNLQDYWWCHRGS